MATQEDLINRRTRNVSPHPGDGICPTITQHHGTATASYETWAKLVSEAKESTVSFHTADGLIKLLQQIPELYPHNSKAFFIHYGSIPHLKYALEWVTTTDPTCERPIRRTYHYLTLGIRQPLACEFSNMSENIPLWAGLQADQMKHLSRLILTWAYILSARWVEILNAAGEKAFMEERKDINGEYFWEMIIERQWQATLVRGDKISYSPWCMEQNTVASRYVLLCTRINLTSSHTYLVWKRQKDRQVRCMHFKPCKHFADQKRLQKNVLLSRLLWS